MKGDTVHNMDALAAALAQQEVPEAWKIYWTDSPVLVWAKEVYRRVTFLRKATTDVKEVVSYDLSAFLNPKKFLTVLTLFMASNYEEAKTLDQLDLVYEVKDKMYRELEASPQVGFNLHGFQLLGSVYDMEHAFIKETNKAGGTEFPIINVQCTEKDEKAKAVAKKTVGLTVDCPV